MHNVPIQHHAPSLLPVVTPWMLRAWPPLLWQAGEPARVPFHHLGTHVTMPSDAYCPLSGQTIWAASAAEGEAGMAWDWVQVARGVVALADPMCVVTNLRLLSDDGEVLTAHASARFLNELVHALPWQHEVARALEIGHA
jgi:hypothetical protein